MENAMTLKEWLKKNRYSQKEFRLMLNPPPEMGNLSRWVNGKVMISLPRAVEIQRITRGRVKPSDWVAEETEAA
jgi:DNA-binding transcriptional regulator YdaS (Cro superfamily)